MLAHFFSVLSPRPLRRLSHFRSFRNSTRVVALLITFTQVRLQRELPTDWLGALF